MAIRRQGLAARRRALGLTQESLAERLGVHPTTVRRWESGYIAGGPHPYTRLQLARHLQVSAEELEDLLAESVRESELEVVTVPEDVSTSGPSGDGEHVFPSSSERGEPTERRDFLKLSLAAAVAPEALHD